MAKLVLMTVCAIGLGIANARSETLELTFGPDHQRGYRPERFADRATAPAPSPTDHSPTEFSSQQRQRQGVAARWYFQKLHNLIPDE